MQKFSTKFQRLGASGCHNYAMIADPRNSLPNDFSTGCLVSIYTIRINSKSFSWAVCSVWETYPSFRQRPISDIG